MKRGVRNLAIAVTLFAVFVLAYIWSAPVDKSVVTAERARALPSVIPPQPKDEDPEVTRERQRHQDRLMEIRAQEMRERLAQQQLRPGTPLLTPGAGRLGDPGMPPEPVLPDPARPVEPLEKRRE